MKVSKYYADSLHKYAPAIKPTHRVSIEHAERGICSVADVYEDLHSKREKSSFDFNKAITISIVSQLKD